MLQQNLWNIYIRTRAEDSAGTYGYVSMTVHSFTGESAGFGFNGLGLPSPFLEGGEANYYNLDFGGVTDVYQVTLSLREDVVSDEWGPELLTFTEQSSVSNNVNVPAFHSNCM